MLGDVQQVVLTGDGKLEGVMAQLSDGLRMQIERSRQAQQAGQADAIKPAPLTLNVIHNK